MADRLDRFHHHLDTEDGDEVEEGASEASMDGETVMSETSE
jgi:hypothetical protein